MMTKIKLGLITTGGTIAMSQSPQGGVVPTQGAEALLAATGLVGTYDLDVRAPFAIASSSLTLNNIDTLAETCLALVAAGCAGIVITHGTDTIEETAFALAFMLRLEVPIVLTAAMRTADQVGNDGPANLAAALKVAADQGAGGRGPLVVIGDEIHAGHLVRKNHGTRVHAFSSAPFGPVGAITEGEVHFMMTAPFDPPLLRIAGPVPPVPMLLTGIDLEAAVIEALAQAPIGGLVVAGVGGGHVAAMAVDALARLAARLPVVLTQRGLGRTLRRTYGFAGGEIDLLAHGLICGEMFRPQQARVLLQLALSNKMGYDSIVDLFSRNSVSLQHA